MSDDLIDLDSRGCFVLQEFFLEEIENPRVAGCGQ